MRQYNVLSAWKQQGNAVYRLKDGKEHDKIVLEVVDASDDEGDLKSKASRLCDYLNDSEEN